MSQQSYTTYNKPSSERTTSDSDDTTERNTCPECNGNTTVTGGERICSDCGLVLNDTQIDHGPEWRAFNASERSKKSRVGAPSTNLMHDKGLSTNIDWKDRDARGNSLSQKKRRQMKRLRTWNERLRTRSSKERGLKFALGEIDRIASALGLPKSTRETASVIFRQAHKKGLAQGRSYESLASASLYAAARQEQLPRSLDELAAVSRVDRRSLQRTYTHVTTELGIAVPNATAQQYLPRFSSELELSDEMHQQARELIDMYYEHGEPSGKTATGIAAAAIYAAGLIKDNRIIQDDIGDVTDTTPVTIRNRYPDLLEIHAEQTGEEVPSA